jgi:hypothetical protein
MAVFHVEIVMGHIKTSTGQRASHMLGSSTGTNPNRSALNPSSVVWSMMAFQRKKPAAIGQGPVSGIHQTRTGNVDRESAERQIKFDGYRVQAHLRCRGQSFYMARQ